MKKMPRRAEFILPDGETIDLGEVQSVSYPAIGSKLRIDHEFELSHEEILLQIIRWSIGRAKLNDEELASLKLGSSTLDQVFEVFGAPHAAKRLPDKWSLTWHGAGWDQEHGQWRHTLHLCFTDEGILTE